MIVCCGRCGNVMSLNEDDEYTMYRCPNCDAVMPSWRVTQLAVRPVESEKKDYRYGDLVPDWLID